MFYKFGLVLLMGVILAGATTTATPLPVLLMMGCLILFALFTTTRREQNE